VLWVDWYSHTVPSYHIVLSKSIQSSAGLMGQLQAEGHELYGKKYISENALVMRMISKHVPLILRV
jgi:hypothetical protein